MRNGGNMETSSWTRKNKFVHKNPTNFCTVSHYPGKINSGSWIFRSFHMSTQGKYFLCCMFFFYNIYLFHIISNCLTLTMTLVVLFTYWQIYPPPPPDCNPPCQYIRLLTIKCYIQYTTCVNIQDINKHTNVHFGYI